VTWLLHQLWRSANIESGLIGTVSTQIGSEILPSNKTTPESDELQALFAVMRERHIRNLAMEVSSHALSQNRVTGSKFKIVAFTNLSQDHLDFHGSMESYFEAKKLLFTFEYAEKGFINIDNEYGNRLSAEAEIPVITLSKFNRKANWYFDSAVATSSGYEVSIRGSGGILVEGKLPLFGEYNLENAIMAVALAIESGVDPIFVGSQMAAMKGAPGRLEQIDIGQPFAAFVDYAHTPDALENVLKTIADIRTKNEQLIAVVGCGGDRDKTKRPIMANIASQMSDKVIFTSDNPRTENPATIIAEMEAGVEPQNYKKTLSIEDRKQAIKTACQLANANDIILIAGKGHETYQEVNGIKHHFDDMEIVKELLEQLNK
jgi:UDP-N-acetylmuramoyl-L-alanyl-D-glutamate--2,6-diaminopimelate ligase